MKQKYQDNGGKSLIKIVSMNFDEERGSPRSDFADLWGEGEGGDLVIVPEYRIERMLDCSKRDWKAGKWFFICCFFFILLFSICMHGFWNGNFLAITERLYFEIQKKIRNGRIVYFFFFYIYVPKWKELILAEALRLECPVSQAIIILKFMKHSDIISVLRHAIKNEFKYA